VECVLFVAGEPVPLKALADLCGAPQSEVQAALDALRKRLDGTSGLHLVEIAGGFQLATKPEFADTVAAYLNPRKRKLSRAALETLAVIAYRQPITLAELEAVRGVNSDHSVKILMEMGLVEATGRKDTVGRPYTYGTTDQFLHQFNLVSLEHLPPIEAET
jgi:segregation and condensation protein B